MASTLLSPVVDYYNDEEDLDSMEDEDDRSFRGRDSEEGIVSRRVRRLLSQTVVLPAGRFKIHFKT